eukprot:scaffold223019_cov32-Tisochrysis_lutea.AAC.1
MRTKFTNLVLQAEAGRRAPLSPPGLIAQKIRMLQLLAIGVPSHSHHRLYPKPSLPLAATRFVPLAFGFGGSVGPRGHYDYDGLGARGRLE